MIKIANWQIEQLAIGVGVLAVFIHLAVWAKLCDRVTRLEAIVKLLENEIKAIHDKDKEEQYGSDN